MEQEVLPIVRSSAKGRLIRDTFCSGIESFPVQCKQILNLVWAIHSQYVRYYDIILPGAVKENSQKTFKT